MISIVTCSVNEERFKKFEENVELTIGVIYEINRIDNSRNEHSICGAYNQGKIFSKYGIVCFIHEDVLFKTQNWGALLIDVFHDKTIGLAGIFGACYISMFAEDTVDRNECIGQIIEGVNIDKPAVQVSRFSTGPIADVIAVDGVFMAISKSVLDKINFSEGLLKGFHGYDFDTCMQVRQTYRVVVTKNLFLAHASNGHYGQAYFDAIGKVSEKWKRYLPAYLPQYSEDELKALLLKSLLVFFKKTSPKTGWVKKNKIALAYAARHGFLMDWIIQMPRNWRALK